jgi:hypothetical protein
LKSPKPSVQAIGGNSLLVIVFISVLAAELDERNMVRTVRRARTLRRWSDGC